MTKDIKVLLPRRPGQHEVSSKHLGQTKRSGYKSWVAAKERCFAINCKDYPRWGGRGVTMCDGWRYNSLSFLDDLGPKPTPTHSIDRIDTLGNYSCGHCQHCMDNSWPMNCRWATKLEQIQNRGPYKRRLITHCKRGHAYDSANTRLDGRGIRVCRACMRLHARLFYNRTKARAAI